MKITVRRGDAAAVATPLLVVPSFEGGADPLLDALDGPLNGALAAARRRGDVQGKEGESVLFHGGADGGPERVLLAGAGASGALTLERLRRVGGTAAKQAAKARAASVAVVLPASSLDAGRAARAVAEGVGMGAYAFTELKSKPAESVALEELVLVVADDADEAAVAAGARVGEVLARAGNLARTLGNLPGNLATPTHLAETARGIAEAHGLTLTVLGPEEMRAEKMGALLGVAAGSREEPRLIALEYRGGAEGDRPLVLVGKGLTFDAGGISIKPAAGMEEMKFDMSGGGAVLGAMQAIAELAPPINVVGVVPSSENLLGDAAMKPGDVLTSHLGKTIEVVNTDAEGRLILADALSWARRFQPAAMVDAATLTGACVIALGHHASGLMGNDEALVDELRQAGERAGERAWPLPMFDDYREQIKSDYADIKNSAGRPAGAITAGWFLREFVGDVPWAHLDVAGTGYGDGKPSYLTKGSTGAPTRLFVEWVLTRAGVA